MRRRTILMYARSRGGKTTQIGELAFHLYKTTGKPSLLYTIDKGSTGPINPYIKLGVIQVVEHDGGSPWHFMNRASNAKVKNDKGEWVKADLTKFAMVAIESLTGFSDAFMNDLAQKSADGVNVGGAANVSFTVNDNNEALKIGGNNMGHYNVVQNRILDEVWRSQRLEVPFIVWTASSSRDEDPNATGRVIGPAVAGKALTAEMLRHFDLTFRLDCYPAGNGKKERHVLFLGNSIDIGAGNAVGLGNTRVPNVDGVDELPSTIEPASVVKALELIDKVELQAEDIIKKQLAKKG